MDSQRVDQLEERLDELRQRDPRADLKPALRSALQAAHDDDERAFILSRIAGELQLELAKVPFDKTHQAKFDEVEALLRRCTEIQPDDPYYPIRLAEHYYYYASDLKKAFEAISAAVEKAEKSRMFVRQAHGTRIRIALDLKDYSKVEESLVVLSSYSPSPGSPDVALERDFLKKIPPGAVRDDVVARYKAIL